MKNAKLEKLAVLDSAICLLLVIIFTAIFVYGFKLGIVGIALSLILPRAVECLLALILENKKGYIHFHFRDFIKLNPNLIKEFFRYATILFICKLMWCLGWTMVSIVIGQVKNDALDYANLTCLVPMKSLVGAFIASAAVSLGIVIARELGANRLNKAKDHSNDIIRFITFVGLVATAIYAFTFLITYLINFNYLSSSEGKDALHYLWIIYLIFGTQIIPQAFNSLLAVGIFSAGGDVKYHSLCDSIVYWFLIIPSLLITKLAPDFAMTYPLVIFTILSLEECLKTPLFIYHFYKYKWIKNITGKEGFVFN